MLANVIFAKQKRYLSHADDDNADDDNADDHNASTACVHACVYVHVLFLNREKWYIAHKGVCITTTLKSCIYMYVYI